MILYLTSSPCVINADRALLTPNNAFLKNIRADVRANARCLYVASSPDDPDANARYSKDMWDAFSEAGIPFREMQILERNTVLQARELVDWCDFILLAGGHVPTQNAFLRETGLPELLQGFEGTVMGISAGTMNSAALVYAQPELPGESVDPAYQRFIPGLGLTFLNILPHYQQVKDDILDGKRLYEDITYADSFGNRFLVLPDGSYVRVEQGESRLYGEGWFLEDGIMRRICENDHSILL